MAVAWRGPRSRFAPPLPVMDSRHRTLQEPTLAFDARGRGYLAGISDCGSSESTGLLFSSSGRGRVFGRPRQIAGAPATHMRLVATGAGRAAVSWMGAACSTSEDLSGLVLVRTLRAGVLSDPAVLDGLPSRELIASPAPGGAADVSWTRDPTGTPDGVVVTSRISPDGLASPALPAVGGWVPVVATARGSQVVERAAQSGPGPAQAVGARGTGGGDVDLAPLTGTGPFEAAAATSGAALAVARAGDDALQVTVWRP